jgi:hypothetical protein
MGVIRRRLSWLIAGWLVCQIASATGAPVFAALGLDEDACCRGLAPGQTCPMHHHSRENDRTCKMRSACPRGETAILALAGGVGILPDATDVVTAFVLGEPVASPRPAPVTRTTRPESPPPRA